MELGTFIAFLATFNFLGFYTSIPFTTIDPSRPFHERLSGSLQVTCLLYAIDSFKDYYDNPPNTDDDVTGTFIGAGVPNPTKIELDSLMEKVREEYAQRNNIVILFPPDTATSVASTPLSSPVTTRLPQVFDDIHTKEAHPKTTTRRPSQKAQNDDVLILTLIGIIFVVCTVCKCLCGCLEHSSESEPPANPKGDKLEKPKEFKDTFAKISDQLDRIVAPPRDSTPGQEAPTTTACKCSRGCHRSSSKRETPDQENHERLVDRLAKSITDHIDQRLAPPRKSACRQASASTGSRCSCGCSESSSKPATRDLEKLIRETRDELASDFRQLQTTVESYIPSNPPQLVHVPVDSGRKDHEKSQTPLQDVSSLETLQTQQVNLKGELEELQKRMDSHCEKSEAGLQNVEKKLGKYFDTGLGELQNSFEKECESLSKKLVDRNLLIEDRSKLRSTVESLSGEVAKIKERLSAVSNEQPSTAKLEQDVNSLRTDLENMSEKVSYINNELSYVSGDVKLDSALNQRVVALEKHHKAAVSSGQSTTKLAQDLDSVRADLERLSKQVISNEKDLKNISSQKTSTDIDSTNALSEKVISLERGLKAAAVSSGQSTADLRQQVDSVRSEVLKLWGRSNSISNDLRAIGGQKASMKLVESVASDVKALYKKVASLEQGQAAVPSDPFATGLGSASVLDSLSQEVSSIKEKLAAISHTDDQSNINHEMRDIRTSLKTLTDRIISLEQRPPAAVSSDQCTDLAKAVADLRADFQNLQEQANSIEGKITAASSDFNQSSANLTEDIDGLRTRVEGLSERMSSVDGDLTAASHDHNKSTAKLTRDMEKLRIGLEELSQSSKGSTTQVQRDLDSALDGFRKEWKQYQEATENHLNEMASSAARSSGSLQPAVHQKMLQEVQSKVDSLTADLEKKHQKMENRCNFLKQLCDNQNDRLRICEDMRDEVIFFQNLQKGDGKNLMKVMDYLGLTYGFPEDKPATPAKEVPVSSHQRQIDGGKLKEKQLAYLESFSQTGSPTQAATPSASASKTVEDESSSSVPVPGAEEASNPASEEQSSEPSSPGTGGPPLPSLRQSRWADVVAESSLRQPAEGKGKDDDKGKGRDDGKGKEEQEQEQVQEESKPGSEEQSTESSSPEAGGPPLSLLHQSSWADVVAGSSSKTPAQGKGRDDGKGKEKEEEEDEDEDEEEPKPPSENQSTESSSSRSGGSPLTPLQKSRWAEGAPESPSQKPAQGKGKAENIQDS
jgi:predicted  nucleic acid-binding Zn-ribbon protein